LNNGVFDVPIFHHEPRFRRKRFARRMGSLQAGSSKCRRNDLQPTACTALAALSRGTRAGVVPALRFGSLSVSPKSARAWSNVATVPPIETYRARKHCSQALYSARRSKGKPMAEDEETATARYIAANTSTQLMLKTIIEIISTMADDPDKYRAGLRVKLLELADAMPLAAMAPAREDKVRAFVRETISTLLTNSRPD
jgi:hypothetical protein